MIRRSTSYGPMLPEGVLEDDGADRGILFVCLQANLARAVRVRQDPVDQRGHVLRRARREGPAGRAERRERRVHRPPAADPPAPDRAARSSWSTAAASTASCPACAPCAGSPSSTPEPERCQKAHAPVIRDRGGSGSAPSRSWTASSPASPPRKGPQSRKTVRTVMSLILGLAVRHEAIRDNPIRHLDPIEAGYLREYWRPQRQPALPSPCDRAPNPRRTRKRLVTRRSSWLRQYG